MDPETEIPDDGFWDGSDNEFWDELGNRMAQVLGKNTRIKVYRILEDGHMPMEIQAIERLQRVEAAARALISDAEECEGADGVVFQVQMHLLHHLEEALEDLESPTAACNAEGLPSDDSVNPDQGKSIP